MDCVLCGQIAVTSTWDPHLGFVMLVLLNATAIQEMGCWPWNTTCRPSLMPLQMGFMLIWHEACSTRSSFVISGISMPWVLIKGRCHWVFLIMVKSTYIGTFELHVWGVSWDTGSQKNVQSCRGCCHLKPVSQEAQGRMSVLLLASA